MDFIALGLSAINTAFKANEQIMDALSAPDKNIDELLRRMREVNGLLIAAQSALHSAADENFELKKAISDDTRIMELRGDMEHCSDGFYIRKSEKAADKFIPYCGTCWSDERLVSLTPGATDGTLHCGKCDTSYVTQGYRERFKKMPSKMVPRSSGPGSWMA